MVVTTKRVERLIALILIIGTLVSILLVLIGGTWYLLQNGLYPMQYELLQANAYALDIRELVHHLIVLSPIGLIELGLLSLVATQLLRVGLLIGFYASIRDYWFVLISTFVFVMLIYSFIWRT